LSNPPLPYTTDALGHDIRQILIKLKAVLLNYRYLNLSREEVEAMFGLSDLKQTRIYQEAKAEGKAEGKLETVPLLLELGLSIEQIAQRLGLEIEAVRRVAQSYVGSTNQGEETHN
jgi:predicted transposase/invertase (TIGR01784 family)